MTRANHQAAINDRAPDNAAAFDSLWVSGMGFHVGIEVPSIEEGLHFYCDLLGMQKAWSHALDSSFIARLSGIRDRSAEIAQLICPGGSRIELIAYQPHSARMGRQLHEPALNHLSLGVRDVQAVYRRLTAAGVEFVCAPIEILEPQHPLFGWLITHFTDPWGTPLELLGPSPARSIDNGERAALARI